MHQTEGLLSGPADAGYRDPDRCLRRPPVGGTTYLYCRAVMHHSKTTDN